MRKNGLYNRLCGSLLGGVLARRVAGCPIALDRQLIERFEGLYGSVVRDSGKMPAPSLPGEIDRFAFLNYLVRNKPVLLHGTTRNDLEVLKPLTVKKILPGGVGEFLYASSEPYTPLKRIWSKRVAGGECRHPFFLKCYRVANKESADLFLFASVNRDLIRSIELFQGTIYVCPSENFVREYAHDDESWYSRVSGGRVSKVASSWVSREEVRPLFRIPFGIGDLPGVVMIHTSREPELKILFHCRNSSRRLTRFSRRGEQ